MLCKLNKGLALSVLFLSVTISAGAASEELADDSAEPLSSASEQSSPTVPTSKEKTTTLSADQLEYDGETGVYRARGDVVLNQGTLSLNADEMIWQDTTRDALASGDVLLAEPGGQVRGTTLNANLTTGLGWINDGRIFMRDRNFHLTGDEIERRGELSYRVTKGRFTTCDGDVPDWQFSADQIDVELGNYAVAHDVWFEVRNRPLFYLPYLVFPVKSERESGFLLPRVGYSTWRGAILSLAWYEVIDRNLDATIYLDYLSKIGLGKGLEYRYALGDDNLGEARVYHVNGFNNTKNSYAIAWRHGGNLPGSVRLTADVEYVNRREFFEDFGEAPEEYSQDHTVSTVMAQRNWDKLNLTSFARYIKDLENDNNSTVQTLPEFGLTVPRYRLDAGPLYSSTELIATNYTRDEGQEGQRLFLNQGIAAMLKPGSWLEFTPEVSLIGRAYHTDETGEKADLTPAYTATVSTRLLRTFSFGHWGIERLQHSIEPQVKYVYIPDTDQSDLPLIVPSDRIGPINQIEYSLINRLTARLTDADGNPFYREIFNLRLSQYYDVREARGGDSDVPGPFSDLRVELSMRPTIRSSLDVDALTQVEDRVSLSRFNAVASLDDGHGNLARLDYLYRNADRYLEGTNYLEAKMATSHFAPVYLGVSERYDFEENSSLETVLDLEYRARCWSLYVTYRDRQKGEDIMIGFALSGIGRVGSFGSTLIPQRN